MVELPEEVIWLKSMFSAALSEFTTWQQAVNYIANQPQVIFDETIEEIDKDIQLHINNRDSETARVIELEARKQALLDARAS